jgi:copper chaperone CopZ
VFLFLGINTIPSLLAFDKHSKNKLEKATITIKDLCCEYCLMGMIEELLFIDGIDKVDSDFDYMNKKNVKFNIMYDENIISADKIKELEKNMNEY